MPASTSGAAGLQVLLVDHHGPDPNGIVCTCPDWSQVAGEVATAGGRVVASLPAISHRDSEWPLLNLPSGEYRVTVWTFENVANMDTGKNELIGPLVQCSDAVLLLAGMTTALTTEMGYGYPDACAFDPVVTGQTAASSAAPSSSLPHR